VTSGEIHGPATLPSQGLSIHWTAGWLSLGADLHDMQMEETTKAGLHANIIQIIHRPAHNLVIITKLSWLQILDHVRGGGGDKCEHF
jgi:hypothetical protein